MRLKPHNRCTMAGMNSTDSAELPWAVTVTAIIDRHLDRADLTTLPSLVEAAGSDPYPLTVLGITAGPETDTPAATLTGHIDIDEPTDVIYATCAQFDHALASHGYTVTSWAACEVMSLAERDRRLAAVSLPKLVDAEQAADILGIAKSGVYRLEKQRAAGERGDGWPAPYVPGYWARAQVEHYARTRRTQPGPAPEPEKKTAENAGRALAAAYVLGHECMPDSLPVQHLTYESVLVGAAFTEDNVRRVFDDWKRDHAEVPGSPRHDRALEVWVLHSPALGRAARRIGTPDDTEWRAAMTGFNETLTFIRSAPGPSRTS